MTEFSEDPIFPPNVEDVQQQLELQYNFRGIETFEELKLCVIPVYIEGDKNKQIFDLLVDTGAEITFLTQPIASIV
ncbi:MAG: hypothetical protein WBM86_25380, partial [Waterburya sp.]